MEDIFGKIDLTVMRHVVFVLLMALTTARLAKAAVNNYLVQLGEKNDYDNTTRIKFFRNTINFLVFTVAFLLITYAIPFLRSIAVTLFAGAGIFAAAIAFASQKAFSNIVSGIFIVVFKPFRVGDMITVGTNIGFVEDITLRHTIIKSLENRRVIIPNSTISSDTIVNSSIEDPKTCIFVEIWVQHQTDLRKAIELMREAALAHPECIDNRSEEDKLNGDSPVTVRVINITEVGILLRAYVWARTPDIAFVTKCDLLETYKNTFEENGVLLALPRRLLSYEK
ncbi:mechanosensitive ion channel family protein [Hugenholtzia roseola]|uniref:mechanosensitive ion channel family protein n=1 Tax=Hugenholtzia roseola TaxID=1002 RepID=UPI00040502B3|nr:mechanosensitive ion channel family protein [Hugenholtzia roseola]